jgi:hypothetical protein
MINFGGQMNQGDKKISSQKKKKKKLMHLA